MYVSGNFPHLVKARFISTPHSRGSEDTLSEKLVAITLESATSLNMLPHPAPMSQSTKGRGELPSLLSWEHSTVDWKPSKGRISTINDGREPGSAVPNPICCSWSLAMRASLCRSVQLTAADFNSSESTLDCERKETVSAKRCGYRTCTFPPLHMSVCGERTENQLSRNCWYQVQAFVVVGFNSFEA